MDGPFEVVKVFPYGTLELKQPRTQETFKVNGQRCKQYFDAMQGESRNIEILSFKDP